MSSRLWGLLPSQNSTMAVEIDRIYFTLIGVSLFFTLLIFLLIGFFAWKYRRRSVGECGAEIPGDMRLELIWIAIPLVIVLFIFAWGSQLYFKAFNPPKEAQEVYVVGKQWMWKFQHAQGMREINTLHVPLGVPIKLTMTSEDVIHSLFIPSFRVKMDVLPNRFTSLWFEATEEGEFHLFCAEYCGTKHSQMMGKVIVMKSDAFQKWLNGAGMEENGLSMGERTFQRFRCDTCHTGRPGAQGPTLAGIFGKEVKIQTGAMIRVDEEYIRESIEKPQEKVVAGYLPVMPTFQGTITEEEIFHLITYIKNLKETQQAEGAP